ncbi:MAG TPA: nuclear transport factor 2 family protein [Burkholderiales bacterium]|jgi:phenylpyruvate tautomerase PptA (4-oxalocrotonate tautomerase family)/ketosteroid isomerase-like protein
MPFIQVTLIEGYSETARVRMSERITRALRATIAAPPDGTIVAINELSPSSWMRGGKSFRSPGPELPEASQVVRDFLEAMGARDLARAQGFLAEDFVMEFPGGVRMHKLAELVEWARPRYRSIAKTYERFDECYGDEATVVYCHGALHGEWPDGKAFSGIRFIDRFTVRAGRLAEQSVWNDLAESRR